MSDIKKSSISRRSNCYLLNLKQPEKTAKRLKLAFQRTSATVTILRAERSMEASVGFVDISETGTGVFTPELLHKGSQIELCITEPYILKVTGLVAWSIPVSSGIHGGKFKCRSGIQFVFEGEQSRFAVQEFVRKVALDPMESIRNAMAAAAAAAAALMVADSSSVMPSTSENPPLMNADGSAPISEAAPEAQAAADVPAAEVPASAEAPAAAAPVAEVAAAPAEVAAPAAAAEPLAEPAAGDKAA